MPRIDLGCATIAYTEHGTGLPLLLLHANPGDSRDFDAVIPALARHHRVFAIDWPGYGESDIPADPASTSADLYYATLKAFITALSLPPVAIIGNSVGGNVAARLAAEHPDAIRCLVLVAPGGFTPHNVATRLFCRLQGSRYALPPGLFARIYLRKRNEHVLGMLARARGLQSEPCRLQLNRALWRGFARPESDLREAARAIRAPVALVFGRFDPVIPAWRDGRAAQSVLPRAAFSVMSSGHAPFAESPVEFLGVVESFLAAQSGMRTINP